MDNITGWFTTEDGVHVPIRGNQSKIQAMHTQFNKENSTNKPMQNKIATEKLSNKNNLINYMKQQIDVDLEKSATEKQFAPRRGLNIDSRKLSTNEFNSLKNKLNKKGMSIQSNGVYDYFITYER